MEKYIGELLFEHDCVIVPDFGGFVCNYSSAKIHPAQHLFSPPFKKLSFNKNLRSNDGLLASYISSSEKKDFSNSLRYIAETIALWNKELHSGTRVDLKNVGMFYLDVERNLQFEPDYSENYLLESFGLTMFTSPPIKRETITKKIEKEFRDRVIIPSREKSTATKTRSYRRVIVTTAIALPLVLVFAWAAFSTDFFKNTSYSNLNPFASKETATYQAGTKDLKTILIPDLKKEKNKFSDTENNAKIVLGKNVEKELNNDADKTFVKTSTVTDEVSTKKFFIIGGCFQVSENAERFLNLLKEKGYPAAKLTKLGRLTPVCYNGFSSKKEALEELSRIKTVDGNAWLMLR